MKEPREVFVISLSKPLLIGIYKQKVLSEQKQIEGQTSQELPSAMKEICDRYEIVQMAYVNGPGSHMAIKVAYTFLKTLSIVKKIPLLAADGFTFNKNQPIKALGKRYFIKENGATQTKVLQKQSIDDGFSLPKNLDMSVFDKNCEPQYHLPAV